MTSLGRGGAYTKVIYYGRWSVRHTNFAANLRQEGAHSEGGAYILVYTVMAVLPTDIPVYYISRWARSWTVDY